MCGLMWVENEAGELVDEVLDDKRLREHCDNLVRYIVCDCFLIIRIN